MKLDKKEIGALIASLILLIFAGTMFFIFKDKGTVKVAVETKASTSSVSLTKIEELLKKAEADPSEQTIKAVETLLNKLVDSSKKNDFNKRLDAVKIKLAEKQAEDKAIKDGSDAVSALEQNPSDDNVTKAQEAVNKIKTQETKDQLQNRIDAVKASLDSATTTETGNEEVAADADSTTIANQEQTTTNNQSQSYYNNYVPANNYNYIPASGNSNSTPASSEETSGSTTETNTNTNTGNNLADTPSNSGESTNTTPATGGDSQ